LHPIARDRNAQAQKLEARAQRVPAGALSGPNESQGPRASVNMGTVGMMVGAAHRLAAKARRGSKEREVVYHGPKAFEDNVKAAHALIDSAIQRHQRFVPGRANAGLFDARGGDEATGGTHVHQSSELRRRLREYKFHRHIEPALPPIVKPAQFKRSGSAPNLSAESAEAMRRRDIAMRNVSSGSLQLQRTDVKRELFLRKNEEWLDKVEQCRLYLEEEASVRQEKALEEVARTNRKGQKDLSKASEAALSRAERVAQMQQMWLCLVNLAGALKRLRDDVHYHKMPTKQICNLVKEKPLSLLKKYANTSMLFRRAFEFRRLEEDTDVQRQAPFIQALFLTRARIKQRRKYAYICYLCAKSWAKAGKIMLAMKTFHWNIRKVQGWWQRQRAHLAHWRAQQRKRWRALETQLCTEELRQKLKQEKQRRSAGVPQGGVHLTQAERVKLMLTDKPVMSQFLEHDLRVLRYEWLTRMVKWKVQFDHYEEEVYAWRTEVGALKALQADEAELGEGEAEDVVFPPAPELPAVPPVSPTDDDLRDMIRRCRLDPRNVLALQVGPSRGDEREHRPVVQQHVEEEEEEQALSARDYLPKVPEPDTGF